MGGPKKAIAWFKRALENSDENFENRGTCEAYISIGEFYRDVRSNVDKGKDKGMYKPLFENISALIGNVAMNSNESERVRLEVLDLARSVIHQYTTNLKRDGVEESALRTMLSDIDFCLSSIPDTTEKISELKSRIEKLIPDTEKAVEVAYNTYSGGSK